MAAVLDHWREAATLILVTSSKTQLGSNYQRSTVNNRDDGVVLSQGSLKSKQNDNFDILLLKRSGKSEFMPNKYVFPGGVAVNSDFSWEWINLFSQLGTDLQRKLFTHVSRGSQHAAPMFTRSRDPSFSAIPPEVAFRICAIRETFEESGILLARPLKHLSNFRDLFFSPNGNLSSSLQFENGELIRDWRHRVNSDPDQFLVMCKELKLVPEIWSLYEWSDWLTPVHAGNKRFDTVFYLCCINHKLDASEDNAEMVLAQWISPSEMVKNFLYHKGASIAMPQAYEMARLFNFSTISDLVSFVAKREPLRVERWLTVPITCKDCVMLVLPGDDLYPASSDLASKEMNKYTETKAEMDRIYPNHNQVWTRFDHPQSPHIQCNIPGARGHVLPVMDVLEDTEQELLTAKL